MKSHSEQAENSLFFQHLDNCCQIIAEQVGEKPILDWTNSDYIKLSGLLSRKTKIHLSESTLKRIFGKSKTSTRYYPQKATRDALAQFIGYRDWYEFEFRNSIQKENRIAPEVQLIENIPVTKKDKTPATWLVLGAFLCVAFILTVMVLKPSGTEELALKRVKLLCMNPNGLTPHSAIFKLDVKGNLPDSTTNFSIDFGDGRLKRTNFLDTMVSHYYELPGRYYPLLFYKDRVIDTNFVYLQTKGWSASGWNQNDTTRVYPVSVPDIEKQGMVQVFSKDAFHAGVDTLHTFFISFANIKPTNISGDNFQLSTKITTSGSRTGVRCSQVDVYVYGEVSRHYLGIIKPECVAWTGYRFSENIKNGKKHDLRAMGYDLSNGGKLELRVENKQVSVFIDNRKIFNTNYYNSIGRIMGVNISFAGIGHFEDFRLSDLESNEVF